MQSPSPEFWWAIGIGSFVILATGGAYLYSLVVQQKRRFAEQQRQQERLRQLSAHLQTVREEERLNIAREIHDELGQVLTVAKMYLTVLLNSITGGSAVKAPEIRQRLDSTISIIDDSIDKVKHIASDLRPIVLDDLGLREAIEWEAKKFRDATGIVCTVRSTPHPLRIGKKRASAVFRIFQEALTNVARHANATTVDVELRKETEHLVLEVRDDGKGIEEPELEKPKSLGILGMKERAKFLKGDVRIRNHNGKGTMVSLTVPLRGGTNGRG